MSTKSQSDEPITAAEMGRLSWAKRAKGKSPEQISRAMKKLAKRRMTALSDRERSSIAAKGGAAARGKPRKKGAGRPKKNRENLGKYRAEKYFENSVDFLGNRLANGR